MELLQLRYFCDAAESENFTHTARKYYVPASNISQCIKKLEMELGKPLFDRNANKVKLNRNGREFYSSIRQALTLMDEAVLHLLDPETEVTGEIKLCILTNRRILTSVVEEFQMNYPKVVFHLNHSNTGLSGKDLVISDTLEDETDFTKYRIIREELLFAMCRTHPLAERQTLVSKDLEKESFITMPETSSLYRNTIRVCGKLGFFPNITMQMEDPYYIREYIEMGRGIALVPALSWEGQFGDKIVLKACDHFFRDTYMFVNKKHNPSKAVRLLLEMIQEHSVKWMPSSEAEETT